MKKSLVIAVIALGSFAVRAQTNGTAAASSGPHVTHIASDSADFDLGAGRHQAVYRGHVRVDDPEMKLACEWLVADLPVSGRINHIVAETNVVIDFVDDRGQTNHATSDKAIYVFEVQNGATNETVTLTGHAQVDNAQMTLTGEPIYVDVENKHMHADNQKMILKENIMASAKTNSTLADTNNLAPPKINLPLGSIENIDRINERNVPVSP